MKRILICGLTVILALADMANLAGLVLGQTPAYD
jgi:hypothetical protein